MLVEIKVLNYSASYAYAPPVAEMLINPDDVVRVTPSHGHRRGPCCNIDMRDGVTVVAMGEVAELSRLFASARLPRGQEVEGGGG